MPFTADPAQNIEPGDARTFESVLADANAVGKSTPELAETLVFQALIDAVYARLPTLATSQLGNDINVRAQIAALLRSGAIIITVAL